MIDFGTNLKQLRIKNHYTQSQLASKLGLTKSVVSAYETGLRMPSYDVLISIASIFKVSTDYLLGIESKQPNLDLSGLSSEQVSALILIVKSMKQ